MKKSILFIAVLFMSFAAKAQSNYNLVIFSEDGEPFFAFVNGIRQNDKPETNIRVTGLNSEALNVRVEFENKALPKLKQNMMPEPGFEHTVNIRRNMKKELKMQYFGKVALAEAPKGSATSVAYHTSENPYAAGSSGTPEPVNGASAAEIKSGNNGNTSVTSTTTTTRVNSDPNNVSININLGGQGMNMDVRAAEVGHVQSSSSTTVTTSSSSSSSGSGTEKNAATGKTAPAQPQEKAVTAGSAGGCRTAMDNASYDKMKKSIESKPFSDTKMSTAKIAAKNTCMSLAQVKGICSLFSMDDDKLSYAKFAYDYCLDKSSYYQVGDVFSFSATTEDFNKFLEGK
jgi:hypothetical protein